MPDYLLEIGCEELPADQVGDAQGRLKTLMAEALVQAQIHFDTILTFGTPRRITCLIKNMASMQETIRKKVKGPPVKSSFDNHGKPLPPAIGFAQKQGITVDQLTQENMAGTSYLTANLTVEGKPVELVLPCLVPRVIEEISGDRLMRWGSSDLKFSRPIRWLVSLLDDREIAITLNALKSGSHTYGHRILAPGKHKVRAAGTYIEDLRQAYVLVDPGERKDVIKQTVLKAAATIGGNPRKLNGPLVEEVVNITEWPSAILGQFENEYLDLPDALIETVMVHHQRYFPVEATNKADEKRLLPYFVSVANNDRAEAEASIKQGNERVLRARLADGRFFYFDDQKMQLSQRKEALSKLSFHDKLGSYEEKVQRLGRAARTLSEALHLDAKTSVCLERTLELCKLDLVTNLVRELPELQGYVGSWYAAQEGEPPEVVAAIASHYSPRSFDDPAPKDTVGCLAAVIDKLDNLVALFASGKRPSGSSDPYILRRQAQGVVDILMDGLPSMQLSMSKIMEQLLSLLQPKLDAQKQFTQATAEKSLGDLKDFMVQRIKSKLLDRGFAREIVESALAVGDPLSDLPDLSIRCKCLQSLVGSQAGLALVKAGVRIGNILKPGQPASVNPQLFVDQSEKILWQTFNENVVRKWQDGDAFISPRSEAEYLELLKLLSKISLPVDALFDNVMVNDPDEKKRANRHGLLKNLDRYFKSIADFTKLQPFLV